ncbi:PRC-barrel domain-containing protein [Haloarcula saliterrae]|nr:PRC-barrel domain-containing protein [Haloarcula sp. S1CR25-12]
MIYILAVSPILASRLSDKQVMSTDGQHVGQVHNITVDVESGDLETLVIKTERSEIFGIEQAADGHIRLPATVLESVRDHLIITPPNGAGD